MCNQQETCSEWITLHRIDGQEVQLEAGSIIGLVPYAQTWVPGTTVITHGGYNVTVREHISEIKELLDFDMVDINDREKLIAQIDTQSNTILKQADTIEYWMKQHDEAAKQLADCNARIASLTETCANQRKKICDMADGGPDMGLSLRREIARLENDIVGLENKIIKKDADIASLTQKLNEVTDALNDTRASRDGWENTAATYARGIDYYKSLIDSALRDDPKSYVGDDGSISEDPLRAKLPEMVNGYRDALKKVTEERDQAIVRAKCAEHEAFTLKDRFCYTGQHGPQASAQRYGYSVIFSDGLSDYAKWPGTK